MIVPSTKGERIKNLRSSCNLTQTELANKIGVSKQTLYKYENNIITNIPSDKVELLALFLNTSEAYLMGWEKEPSKDYASLDIPNLMPLPRTYSVPLLGEIACGDPILAEQNIIDQIPVPEHIKGADFALTCKGDSMINARIHDGDIVYIHQQPNVENGQIAAVLIENEATLKRVRHYENKIVLYPENPAYEPLIFTGEELENIKIIGRAIAFLSPVK